MYCVRKVEADCYYVGASDRRLSLFENLFPIEKGVSYNSFLIMDEKTALIDSVDFAVARQFLENVDYVLGDRTLDYLVINHLEPDHGALIEILLNRFPQMQLVINEKMIPMIRQFFNCSFEDRCHIVKEHDELCLGTHTLTFVMAPLVHWPEVMMTYDNYTKVLFAADAFGAFGALGGSLFDDELDFERVWLDEARRYYTNIVGKFGKPVQNALKKVGELEISLICSLHGPILRSKIGLMIEKYTIWSSYEPEKKGVLILYGSMYGNTENAVNVLATALAEKKTMPITIYDVSRIHYSYLISEIFKYSHVVLASPTYNNGVYPMMENLLVDMKALNIQNRTVALIENGTWAPASGKLITKHLEEMKEMNLIQDRITIKSGVKEDHREGLLTLAEAISMDLLLED